MTGAVKRRCGFAAMDPDKQRAIASLGGAAQKSHNRSFSRDPELASKAGRLGGMVSRGGGRSKRVPV